MIQTHYDTLKVARDAPAEVIRAAYRALSQRYHPDRNPEDDDVAAQTMRQINSAYHVLSNAKRRAEHDAWIRSIEAPVFRPSRFLQPVLEDAAVADESTEDPLAEHVRRFGPVYAILLLFLTVYFGASLVHRHREHAFGPHLTLTDDEVARATSTQSLEPPQQSDPTVVRSPSAKPSAAPAQPYRDLKKETHPVPKAASAPALAAAPRPEGTTAAAMDESNDPIVRPAPSQEIRVAARPLQGKSDADGGARAGKGPNGEAWPMVSGYMPGSEILLTDGGAQVVVDNSKNPSDIYAKLVYLSHGGPTVARTVFVSARDNFAIRKLRTGAYEIDYRNLDSGKLVRSDILLLEESIGGNEPRYNSITVRMQPIADENLRTYPISEDEFATVGHH